LVLFFFQFNPRHSTEGQDFIHVNQVLQGNKVVVSVFFAVQQNLKKLQFKKKKLTYFCNKV